MSPYEKINYNKKKNRYVAACDKAKSGIYLILKPGKLNSSYVVKKHSRL